MYADHPQQNLPSTEAIVKACQWFPEQFLTEKRTIINGQNTARQLTSYLSRSYGGSTRPFFIDYLLRHTRLIPRDVVSLGNAICAEILRQKAAGRIAADTMPKDAARHGYSEVYTSTMEYLSGIDQQVRETIREVGYDRFSREELELGVSETPSTPSGAAEVSGRTGGGRRASRCGRRDGGETIGAHGAG